MSAYNKTFLLGRRMINVYESFGLLTMPLLKGLLSDCFFDYRP